jgi:GTP cyclohydrolase I
MNKDGNKVIESVKSLLEYIGEDPSREGLLDTPKRVLKSYDKLFGGYAMDPKKILQTGFTEMSDEMILLKNIEFYSTCEHHMLPFFGKIHVAYIPANSDAMQCKVVGISKLARLVECFARRLQIQERLVNQIADSLVDCLGAAGVMVVAEAQHMCMTARGVEKQSSVMVTSAIRGVFKKPETRTEFLNLIKE